MDSKKPASRRRRRGDNSTASHAKEKDEIAAQHDAPSSKSPMISTDSEQMQALRDIREFLKVRTSYDVLPLSFRMVVLDVDLLIKRSIGVLVQNGIASAPLWDSKNSKFVGLLSSGDFLNVIQYCCQFPDKLDEVDQFCLRNIPANLNDHSAHKIAVDRNCFGVRIPDIEEAIGVQPMETVSVHPMRSLYEACRHMLVTRARRIPLVDIDDETGREWVVCVLTQYRILKFIAVNNELHTNNLRRPVRDLGLGTYEKLVTVRMNNTVLDVVHLMVKYGISAVPVVDRYMHVLNVFEAVDVIPCITGGKYYELTNTVGEALTKRGDDFAGMYSCSPDDRLDAIFDTIRKSRVHRFVVVDEDNKLQGVISLSDILKYLLLTGESEDSASAASAKGR